MTYSCNSYTETTPLYREMPQSSSNEKHKHCCSKVTDTWNSSTLFDEPGCCLGTAASVSLEIAGGLLWGLPGTSAASLIAGKVLVGVGALTGAVTTYFYLNHQFSILDCLEIIPFCADD